MEMATDSMQNGKVHQELYKLVQTMPPAIKEKCVFRNIKAGTTILHDGDKSDTVHILISGMVQVVDKSIYGIAYAFSNYPAYDIFGEMEALGDYERYKLAVRAISDSQIITMPKDVFLNWIKTDINVILILSKMLTGKLWEASEAGRNRLLAPALVQIMMYFSSSYEKIGEAYICHKTRQQIADETGLSVKTVNRSIKTLNEMTYLTLKKGHVYMNGSQHILMLQYLSNWIS